jgi:hypothetical protein
MEPSDTMTLLTSYLVLPPCWMKNDRMAILSNIGHP